MCAANDLTANSPRPRRGLGRRLRAVAPWLLLVGYLPSLTFLGHIPLDFNIPGTSWYIGMPEIAGAAVHHDFKTVQVGEAFIQVHEEHCHTNLGSCSDAPWTGSASFALMGWVIAFLGAAGALFALSDRWWRPHFAIRSRPLVPPPRFVSRVT